MHHQMRVRNFLMDGFDSLDVQNIARWRARKFISAVTGANRNGQRIAMGLLNKIRRLIWIG